MKKTNTRKKTETKQKNIKKKEPAPKKSIHEQKARDMNMAKKEPTDKKNNDEIKITPSLIATVIIIALVGLYLYDNTGTQDPKGDYTVKKGDTVYLKFTQKLENGTILDTNYEDIAKEIGITRDKYPPLIFIVGKGMAPPGLENGVLGMKSGEKKTITLAPKDAYGEYKTTLVGTAERIQKQPRNITVLNYESLTSDKFKEVFKKRVAILGDDVSTDAIPWKYTITDIKPDNITVKAKIKVGEAYKLPDTPYWNSTAIEVKDEETTFRQDPEVGLTVPTQLGNATATTSQDAIILTINPDIGDIYVLNGIPAKVTEVNEYNIVLDANHPLAGKTIVFDIELLQRVKATENTTNN
ncbi:MAG: FKBP-type peptidyl-prolyl cis-trans isomerase [archaeon]